MNGQSVGYPRSLMTSPPKKLRTGEYGKHITYFPSQKNREYISCESLLESDFCLYLEYLPAVQRYISHPIRFILNFGPTKTLKYTPDFFVKLADGSWVFYEIKPDSQLEGSRTQEKLLCFQRALAEHGYLLETIAESHFRKPTLFHNLNYLYAHSFGATQLGIARVVHIVEDAPSRTIRVHQLLEVLNPPTVSDIASAVFNRKVHANLNRFFSTQTQISVGERR
ncbi:TnsA endonuclease N-terminal domain-containing protein [Pseudomonas sp. TCU-HL1]|uniref:TnsA endonuclease N-terminal domain-containing protein n=1 Tax=Pseudomonas sp. TCU-HL1 TaxID=1856685 RepID=UPI0008590DF1|nr:TnsA endonuclease N-terminal domain-containing protein [Pseudomonas sp. TCU-HL1]AOE86747.1 TnsA endonuclease [Pseudomonas sp. TCU-HL1]